MKAIPAPVVARICFLLVLGSFIAAGVSANKKPPAAPVNLNTATSEELQTVPGIGPATADKILQMRKNYGAFKSVDDLLAIKGIGPKRLEKMRKYLTVGKASSSTKPATLTKPAAPQPKADPPGPPRSSRVKSPYATKAVATLTVGAGLAPPWPPRKTPNFRSTTGPGA